MTICKTLIHLSLVENIKNQQTSDIKIRDISEHLIYLCYFFYRTAKLETGGILENEADVTLLRLHKQYV